MKGGNEVSNPVGETGMGFSTPPVLFDVIYLCTPNALRSRDSEACTPDWDVPCVCSIPARIRKDICKKTKILPKIFEKNTKILIFVLFFTKILQGGVK